MSFIVVMKRKYQHKTLQMRFSAVSVLSYSLSCVDLNYNCFKNRRLPEGLLMSPQNSRYFYVKTVLKINICRKVY